MSKNTHEFESLFDDDIVDDKSKEVEELFTFDSEPAVPAAPAKTGPAAPARPVRQEEAPPARREEAVQQKRRTSEDFSPDMDALLITAQSSLIIEGLKYLTLKDFSTSTLQVYIEAVKGVEVFIKILERNPNNYFKLSSVINADEDCKEIETVAFKLYRVKHHTEPDSDSHYIQAYEMLRNRLKIGYNKSLVSTSIVTIKKYYLMTGNLDREKVSGLMLKKNQELKDDAARFAQHLNIAIQLTKIGDVEITKGLRGKDMNNFIIKASQFLAYYNLTIGDTKMEEFYRRINDNYRKYLIIR